MNIKSVNITTATTTTVSQPGRIVGVAWVQPYNVAAGKITLLDGSTSLAIIDIPRTNDSDAGDSTSTHGSIMFPHEGFRCETSIVCTNAITTHVTVFYA
jgi:hypothetical protein